MHQTLYRKYRPAVFADVCGQDSITTILRGQVSGGKFSHAYLFCGSRGTGKTTCAKILAKAMNCTSPVNGDPCGKCAACRAIDSGMTLDITEIDAASNNRVDDVRELIEKIAFPPAELKYRVYIIDEVHMLTIPAFNALLKTLEEPPAHAVFILATTEIHKLPATIISRCQRYDFSRIDSPVIAKRLRYIADCENIQTDDDALFLMARLSMGGMRDAIGYLELCSGIGEALNEKNTSLLLGASDYGTLLKLTEAVLSGNVQTVFTVFDRVCSSSGDLLVFWFELTGAYRDILAVKVTDSDKYVNVTPNQYKILKSCCAKMTRELLLSNISIMNDAAYLMQKNPAQKRVIAEMTLIKLCDARLNADVPSLLARISALEDRLTVISAKGIPAVQPPIAAAPAFAAAAEESAPGNTPRETAAPDTPAEQPVLPVEKPAVPPAADIKKELRPLKRWKEISAKISAREPASGCFLSDCKTYECEQDGTLHIVLSNEFFINMATRMKDTVDDAVIAVLGGKYPSARILLECTAQTSEYSIFDELEDASDDF